MQSFTKVEVVIVLVWYDQIVLNLLKREWNDKEHLQKKKNLPPVDN